MDKIAHFLLGSMTQQDKIPDIEKSTLIATDDPVKTYSSYILRVIFASFIATCAIAAQSTAIIIGAMLIAPLMSPIIGTSFAITTGKPKAAIRTIVITLGGMLIVILVAALVSLMIPTGINFTGNTEVTSRTSPRVVDLMIAIASGFVGALSVGRDDISDAVPGVAISVSIVPPLCIVGCALLEGQLTLAGGAFLLFLVNFFAIQLAGNLFFFLMGFGKRNHGAEQIKVRRFWYITAIVGTLILAVPLVATSNQLINSHTLERETKQAAVLWLEDSGYELVDVNVVEGNAIIEIAGEGAYPDINDLSALLEARHVVVPQTRVMATYSYHS